MNAIAKRLQKLELRCVQEDAQASALLELLEHRPTIWLARKGLSQGDHFQCEKISNDLPIVEMLQRGREGAALAPGTYR